MARVLSRSSHHISHAGAHAAVRVLLRHLGDQGGGGEHRRGDGARVEDGLVRVRVRVGVRLRVRVRVRVGVRWRVRVRVRVRVS